MRKLILLAALFSMSCTRIYFVCIEKPVEIPNGAWQLLESPDPGFNIKLTPGHIYFGGDTIESEYLQKYDLLNIRTNENN